MSKYGRQRRRQSARANHAEDPDEDPRWLKPPTDECNPEEPPARYALSSTSRITQRQVSDDRGPVDYAVMHEVRGSGGQWVAIVQIDCSHQEVHVHKRFGATETREILRIIRGRSDVIETIQESYNFIFDNWEEHERRWRNG